MNADEYFKQWKPTASWLSKKEKEIVKLCMTGLTDKEVGHKLFRSECTIKTHFSNIHKKFPIIGDGYRTRAKLLSYFWMEFAEDYSKIARIENTSMFCTYIPVVECIKELKIIGE